MTTRTLRIAALALALAAPALPAAAGKHDDRHPSDPRPPHEPRSSYSADSRAPHSCCSELEDLRRENDWLRRQLEECRTRH
jgi:hypothetical protein